MQVNDCFTNRRNYFDKISDFDTFALRCENLNTKVYRKNKIKYSLRFHVKYCTVNRIELARTQAIGNQLSLQ